MSIEDDILIERFLKNELSEKEHTSFLARMESDVSFKEQVVLETQLLQVLGNSYWSFATNDRNARVKAYQKLLESDETQQLKASIAKTIKKYKQENNPTSSRNSYNFTYFIKIAAVLTLFFVSIFWYFSPDKKIDLTALTEKAWNKNVGLDFTVRSNSSDSTKVALEKALQYYTYQKYDSVLSTLNQYTNSNVQYKNVLLLRALSHYKLQKPQVALKTLDSLKIYAPNISQWYQGLIYLDQKKLKKASLLLKIPSKADQEIKLKN